MSQRKTLWDYFKKDEKGESGKCLLCSATLKISQRSTKGLTGHLKSKHCVNFKSSDVQEEEASTSKNPYPKRMIEDEKVVPKKKVRTIDSFFFKDNSMEKMVSRMIAKDNFTFNSFCTSVDLRYLFSKSGFQLPTSSNTIRSMVVNFSESVKADIMKEFTTLKKQNQKFSITFDEWTAQNNRRYLNVNLHMQAKHFNLGLNRIRGSCNAENCIDLVKKKLNSFGIELQKDIIAMTTDGASVMVKVGKLMPCYQQLCYAHGIQLAVIDILYKKNSISVEEQLTYNNSEDEDDTDGEEAINEDLTMVLNQPPAELANNYRDLIKKVRKAVKTFKNSPTKNDKYLQKYVLHEHGKQLNLILDCQTRWNSLFDMLERFYCLKLCIGKALIDISSEIRFSLEEWSEINNLILGLEPLKIGLEALCRRESNLFTAETTFRFMLDKLDQQSSVLSTDLAAALRERLKQRRNTNLTGLLIYLRNPQKYEQELKKLENTFPVPKKTGIRQEIKKLLTRVYEFEENDVLIDEQFIDDSLPISANISLKEELEIQLQKEKWVDNTQQNDNANIHSCNLEKILKMEMTTYENGGVRGKYLTMIYNFLMTISPTSVESERAFSAAGYICSPLRSRLGDDTLSSICFLRSHFSK